MKAIINNFILALTIAISLASFDFDDCHYINNDPKQIEFICNGFKGFYQKDNCWYDMNASKIEVLKESDCGTDILNQFLFHQSYLINYPNVRVLDLSFTRFKHLKFNQSVSSNFTSLIHTFNMSHNILSEMPHFTFTMMPKMKAIDFSYNNIRELNQSDFYGADELTIINFSHNILTFLRNEIFSMVQNLEFLDLSSNRIQTIDNDFINKNPKLKVLNLRDNQLQNIPVLLKKLGPNLEILDLSQNSVMELKSEMFNKLTNLQNLNLSRANISTLEENSFSDHLNLRTLDLSYNSLTKAILSKNTSNLSQLNLEGNHLKEIDNITPVNFQNLTSFAISRNYFSCDYLEMYLRQWDNVEKLHLIKSSDDQQRNIKGIYCDYIAETIEKTTMKIDNDRFEDAGKKPSSFWQNFVIVVLLIIVFALMGLFQLKRTLNRKNRNIIRAKTSAKIDPETDFEIENNDNRSNNEYQYEEGQNSEYNQSEHIYEEIDLMNPYKNEYNVLQFNHFPASQLLDHYDNNKLKSKSETQTEIDIEIRGTGK